MLTSSLIIVALAYGLIVLGMYLLQDKLMYHGSSPAIALADTAVSDMTEIRLQTSDGLSLRAWYKAASPEQKTIVYFHGNAGTIADRAYKARYLIDQGLGVLLLEYRGFGGNPGNPSEAKLIKDADAAIAYALDHGAKASDIVLYGESLGTGIAVDRAAAMAVAGKPVAAVVLEAPYTAISEVAQKHYPYLPAKWLVRDKYDSLSKIQHIAAPLFIMHGDNDRVVPQFFGKMLFERAIEPKQAQWIAGAHHTNPFDLGGGAGAITFISDLK